MMTGSENNFLSTSCGDGKEGPVMAVVMASSVVKLKHWVL